MKNNSLQKRLAAYTALAVPFFSMSNHADAQILYTDVSPDDTLNMCDTVALDLNNDGVIDFMLGVSKNLFYYWHGCMIMKETNGFNRIAGIATNYTSTYGISSGDYFRLPFKLNYLDPIGATDHWVNPQTFNYWIWCNGAIMPWYNQAVFNFFTDSFYKGNWNTGPTDGYIGLRINVNNQTYYGWARLSVDSEAYWMILKDYAIDTIPNQSIGAGEGIPTAIGFLESNESSVVVSPNPASDHFLITFPRNNSVITQLNMIDVEGRKRMVEWIKSENGLLVNTNGLDAGIYFAEVKTANTVYRKKVVLQR